MEQLQEKEYLTKEQLAQKINMSVKFVEDNTYLRKIPGAVKMGRYWRYRTVDIEKALLSGNFLLQTPSKTRTYHRPAVLKRGVK